VNLAATTGAMNTKRTQFAVVQLGGGGQCLVIGGLDQNGNPLASAELFNPASGTWTTLAGVLNVARYNHAAINVNGAILVLGGQGAGAAFLSSVEIFLGKSRPEVTGVFSLASNGLSTARANMVAELLAGGVILVAGGDDSGDAALNLAEIYSPGV
jgi:hypothetical protein